MDRIRNVTKQTSNRFLNMYKLEVAHRDGRVSPYYMASRAEDPTQVKAVTKVNNPNGVIMYGIYGEQKDKVVLVRQYRYPIAGFVYEFPAGLVENGEDLLTSGAREMYEETGLTFTPVGCSPSFYMAVGTTDESCGTVFGYCSGEPTNCNQEESEEIQVVIADKEECRRILREEHVALPCAYMLMHFISSQGDPLEFLKAL